MAKGILENMAKDIVIEGCETKLRQQNGDHHVAGQRKSVEDQHFRKTKLFHRRRDDLPAVCDWTRIPGAEMVTSG
ncbi:hypothetical protein PCANC_25273 [Puccinia coronata f. sp. avenae]|uniref:Uncharacterized protein n=1 Tax=Puccinia coronata f. sp. avenae TaxID=200324 RepID=A0A2N5U571_9BASI|nr:hypothetical protein PCASD_25139 [Puccinia coronata f. sp. avenae]PLW32866.1 hypothetical protein PCANC_25273 [Puccinia coronata f. sp. avenae]